MKTECERAENCDTLKRLLTKYTPEEIIDEGVLYCYSKEKPPCDLYHIVKSDEEKSLEVVV
jgi:hypothetical protein